LQSALLDGRLLSSVLACFCWVAEEAPPLALFGLSLLLLHLSFQVIGFLTNLVSRAFEYQADNFAVKLGKGQDLRDALLKLEETNKASLNFDPLYSGKEQQQSFGSLIL